ncbi:MAG: recombination protein O N-terminal domain-containing protein [Muribaculaceae bacterium]|nr:recombination protein O N-terminal domain-containing protein [Muribaculaceae bacterium]
MYENLECISLRTVPYDDSRSIATVWTRQRGRMSLMVPSGSGREARRRRALMMPLGLFEGCVDIRPGREIFSMRDVRPISVHTDIACDPAKGLVAMFLGEVLDRVLRTSVHDPLLSDYIFGATDILEAIGSGRGTANFAPVFLCKLMRFLGIEPDWGSYRRGTVFDMEEGTFRTAAPTVNRWLPADEAAVAHLIGRMGWNTIERMPMTRETRRCILSRLLEYYSMHGFNLSHLKSLEVATEVF